MAFIKSASSLGCILAALVVVSNEIRMAESGKYNDCLGYCKNEFKKDIITCHIWCHMKCMPSLGYNCLDTGVGKSRVPASTKNNIDQAADPPASTALKSIAQKPFPEFFKTMEKSNRLPELQQLLEAIAQNSTLPPSPSPTLPPNAK